jgi:hypothetical protein
MDGKYWVNAPGAKSVSYDTREQAWSVAAQVQGSTVSYGAPKERGILVALVRMIKGVPDRFKMPRGHN